MLLSVAFLTMHNPAVRSYWLAGLILVSLAIFYTPVEGSAFVGFNYGTQLAFIPAAQRVINLLKIQQVNHIRLYDANASVLQALAGTGIQVVVSVPNNQLLSVGQSSAAAANWVKNNIVAYLPKTNITGICVGTEVLTSYANAALILLPAMKNIHYALVAAHVDTQVKVSTPHSTAIILDSFPPSQAYFNKSLHSFMVPMLDFLSKTGSYFMLNVYTYDIYKQNKGSILLDYALMNPLSTKQIVVDSNTLLPYSNLFDAVVDSAFFAMARLNYTNIPLVVGETGWPSQGDATDTEATAENAAAYNSNLIRHIMNNTGTPKFPGKAINTYIFELFNEDSRTGSVTLKNYGLFNSSNLAPVYWLHLTGSGPLLANDTTNQLYCVAKPGVDDDTLQIALDWACGTGQADCVALQPGKLCYEPDTVVAHASYAFNNYYQRNRNNGESCDFGGSAIVTTTNPSYGACIYPGSSNTSIRANSTAFVNSPVGGNGTSVTASAAHSVLSSLHILLSALSLVLVMGATARF